MKITGQLSAKINRKDDQKKQRFSCTAADSFCKHISTGETDQHAEGRDHALELIH